MTQIITSYEDTFTFGKYKGKSFDKLLIENPSYIEWCLENKVLDIPDKEMREVVEACIEDHYENVFNCIDPYE